MSGSDYDSLSSDVIFLSGSNEEDTECVNVTITDDILFEANETITLTLTTSDLDVSLENNETTITITDTDSNSVPISKVVFTKHDFLQMLVLVL